MSSEQQNLNKTAVNLYGILDNELVRMHELLRIHLSAASAHYQPHQPMGSYNHHSSMSAASDASEIYKRIISLQDLLVQSIITHDKELQEKIAELALTGVDNGHKR